MAKKKSKLKKALMAGAALAGGLALAKGRRHAGVKDQDDGGRGVNWYGHRMDDLPLADHSVPRYDDHGVMFKKGGKVTGIAKRGFGRALMKGKK
jgi:hypothetical protein